MISRPKYLPTQRVFCCDCKHWGPMKASRGEIVLEEHCKASPGDTYLRPASLYAKPWNKNSDNQCEDFEAKE